MLFRFKLGTGWYALTDQSQTQRFHWILFSSLFARNLPCPHI
jgi:hypothetical protein